MPFNFLGKEYLSFKDFAGQNKKALAVLAVVGLVVIVLIIRGAWPDSRLDSSRAKVKWQNYSSEALGFSISLPLGWKVTEEDAESGPDIMILDENGLAFVRIRGFVDPYLDSKETITSSIAEYQKALALQEGVKISDFQTKEIKDDIGGFWLSGEFLVNSRAYRFEERGWLSMAGQILILRAADVPESFDKNLPAMKIIMDNFKLQ